jgi:hypothetical protein
MKEAHTQMPPTSPKGSVDWGSVPPEEAGSTFVPATLPRCDVEIFNLVAARYRH